MANGAYRVVIACRLCDSEQLTEALNLGETPLANELGGTELFPLVVMRCDDCEHHQLSIAVNPERLWGPNYPYQSGTSPVFRKHLEALADEVAALKPEGLVLEIAANDGTLVRELRARKLEAIGIDPSSTSPDVLCASWPYQQMAYKWPEQPFMSGRRADCILALNVFAHVDDLHSFTAAVKEALAPDGVFIVEVGCLPLMCQRGVFDTIYHEHFSYHTVNALVRFFGRHDLHIVKLGMNESQGGSLRCYVTHHPTPFVRTWVEDERADMAKLRERIKLTKVGLAMALGGTAGLDKIAGYGCPAKLTTLMYATGLADTPTYKLTCIYDDNPLKVGKFTPGTLIPIVPSANLVADAPDTLILFAWNFASEIIPRLRAQGYKGRIITPLPEVEVDEV